MDPLLDRDAYHARMAAAYALADQLQDQVLRDIKRLTADPRYPELVKALGNLSTCGYGEDAACFGAMEILRASEPMPVPAPRNGRPSKGDTRWQGAVGSRTRLLDYGLPGATPESETTTRGRAEDIGPPPEWHRAILLESMTLFHEGQPIVEQMRSAALALHARTSRRYTNPAKVWFALRVLDVAREITGRRLPVYDSSVHPDGATALVYVIEIRRIFGQASLDENTRWPTEYTRADQILRDLAKHPRYL